VFFFGFASVGKIMDISKEHEEKDSGCVTGLSQINSGGADDDSDNHTEVNHVKETEDISTVSEEDSISSDSTQEKSSISVPSIFASSLQSLKSFTRKSVSRDASVASTGLF